MQQDFWVISLLLLALFKDRFNVPWIVTGSPSLGRLFMFSTHIFVSLFFISIFRNPPPKKKSRFCFWAWFLAHLWKNRRWFFPSVRCRNWQVFVCRGCNMDMESREIFHGSKKEGLNEREKVLTSGYRWKRGNNSKGSHTKKGSFPNEYLCRIICPLHFFCCFPSLFVFSFFLSVGTVVVVCNGQQRLMVMFPCRPGQLSLFVALQYYSS